MFDGDLTTVIDYVRVTQVSVTYEDLKIKY